MDSKINLKYKTYMTQLCYILIIHYLFLTIVRSRPLLYFFRKEPVSYAVRLALSKMNDMSLMAILKHYLNRREKEKERE